MDSLLQGKFLQSPERRRSFTDAVGLRKADVFGYSMGAAAGLQLAIRHPERVNKLAAASAAYGIEDWQPAFREFIPQMNVEMLLEMPFAKEYPKLATSRRSNTRECSRPPAAGDTTRAR